MVMAKTWKPDSWRDYPIRQVPEYPDQGELKFVENELGGGGGRQGFFAAGR